MNVGQINPNSMKPRYPGLFAPDSNPFGVSYSQWTVMWWKWYLSQPKSTSPAIYRQKTNISTGKNQIDSNVWFLAGTTDGYAERSYTIPGADAILCPVINFEISTAEKPELKTDQDLTSYARDDVDNIAKVNATIDGVNLPESKKFRVESGPFDVTLLEDNIWGVKAGPTRAAADGYWLFLKPLTKGSHQLRLDGSCLAGTINLGTTYYLRVE